MSAQLAASENLLVTGDVIGNTKQMGSDELVTVWDLITGLPLAVLRDKLGQVGNTAISPNGKYVAYGSGVYEAMLYSQKSTGDYDLRVWRIANDEPIARPERPIRWESSGMLIGGRPVSSGVPWLNGS